MKEKKIKETKKKEGYRFLERELERKKERKRRKEDSEAFRKKQ